MNVQRLQGLALIVSAVCLLLGLFVPAAATFFFVTSTILFILGVPAIHSAQPTGSLGMVGIVLLELGALIAFAFQLGMVPDAVGNSLSLTSAIAAMLGAVIVGWLTTREHVFPAWVGWAFLAQGVLNLVFGMLNLSSLAIVPPLLQVAALLAYGYFIYQKPVHTTVAKEYKVPLG